MRRRLFLSVPCGANDPPSNPLVSPELPLPPLNPETTDPDPEYIIVYASYDKDTSSCSVCTMCGAEFFTVSRSATHATTYTRHPYTDTWHYFCTHVRTHARTRLIRSLTLNYFGRWAHNVMVQAPPTRCSVRAAVPIASPPTTPPPPME